MGMVCTKPVTLAFEIMVAVMDQITKMTDGDAVNNDACRNWSHDVQRSSTGLVRSWKWTLTV